MSGNVSQTAAVCGAGWMAAGDVSQLWYEMVVSQLCGYLQASAAVVTAPLAEGAAVTCQKDLTVLVWYGCLPKSMLLYWK